MSGLQAGAYQNRRGIRAKQSKRGGVSAKRGHNYNKAGEGVCNQNGKGRVALKKISVQNPQNHFGYQNVLVSKKFSEKISGK